MEERTFSLGYNNRWRHELDPYAYQWFTYTYTYTPKWSKMLKHDYFYICVNGSYPVCFLACRGSKCHMTSFFSPLIYSTIDHAIPFKKNWESIRTGKFDL